MKKIFVDIYLQFNLGDDLFLDILAKKYPNCKFTLNYLGKGYNRFLEDYSNVMTRKYTFFDKVGQKLKIKDSITNYDEVAEAHDALLFIGGSIFREESYHRSLYEERFNMISEFNRRKKPIFILGANFGPFSTDAFYDDYKKLFQMCDDVCFRDSYSYHLYKDLPQVRYAPDIVFQMDTTEYMTIEEKDRIGFSIIDVTHKQGLAKFSKEYIETTIKSIELLTKKGYTCYLMSFCEKEGDIHVINQIKQGLTPEAIKGIQIYEYKGNLIEAMRIMASFKLFFAARFHANIIGLIMNAGIMPIIYNDKTTNMLEDLKLNSILVTMNNLKLQHSEKFIESAFHNKTSLEKVKNESHKQFAKLSQFILENNDKRAIV